jgi:hypothetical protein
VQLFDSHASNNLGYAGIFSLLPFFAAGVARRVGNCKGTCFCNICSQTGKMLFLPFEKSDGFVGISNRDADAVINVKQ